MTTKPTTKSLLARGNQLASSQIQLQKLGEDSNVLATFEEKLDESGLIPFLPTAIEILQINLGKMCNQVCEHCHVDAGPDRKEIMTKEVMQYCLDAIKKGSIKTVDLTGGAPEMNPNFKWFVEEIRKLDCEVIVRSNLTILNANQKYKTYPQFFKEQGVTVISSLPCYTAENTDKQRGNGVFEASIQALKALNNLGYGKEDTGLELHLVYNPGGAFLPPPQQKLEKDYKVQLMEHFGIEFNNLFTITNLPISRFLDYLLAEKKYDSYMQKLIDSYNPEAAKGVMCRNTISVSWEGKLYDCDFNQMLDMELDNTTHIKDFSLEHLQNRKIKVSRHCFGCTAGAGSSCQGSLV